ncbi:MAG: hypothetical protein GYB36_12475 [Alphaproteobacteria bacterium]|nr:hypothetical protein [Alphaproteobacteria bacterium]
MERTTLTRQQLYELVWSKPMTTLAKDFGITGNGLAKICERLGVPRPPRGYWAKKEAGKKVIRYRLPARQEGQPETAIIRPTPRIPKASADEAVAKKEILDRIKTVKELPKFPSGMHRLVKPWIEQHREEQNKSRRRARDRRGWAPEPRADLTERDQYRFRVTSALFTALEAAGVKIDGVKRIGEFQVTTDGQTLQIVLKEKMQRAKPAGHEPSSAWTAYPHDHQTGLYPSGFVQAVIKTHYAGRYDRRWIESRQKDFATLIPSIVAEVIEAGPIIAREKEERAEAHRRYEEEAERRRNAARDAALDDARWEHFRALAADWEEVERLNRFIEKLESSAPNAEGLRWARARLNALDPTKRDVWNDLDSVKVPYSAW